MTLIKNCGLKTMADIDASARSGSNFIGFVHHAASPRHLGLPEMAALNMQKPTSVKSMVVMVDPTDHVLDDVVAMVRPDYLQIHKITAARAALISERTRLPLVLGVAMREPDDLKLAHALEPIAEHLLLDAPESGSGVAFEWSVLADARFKKPWFLAGGLTIANVVEAIRLTGAPMVDVSSGIEQRLGQKSPEMIAAFNKAVLATHP